jgi:thiosulfate dehydrogenase [quinone] large subunit
MRWIQRSKSTAIIWTAMRVWLGIMWIQAGVAKLWGAENPAFLHHGAPGVVGLASHASPAYSWWGHFLHGFVLPNAGWIGILVAVAEFVIGIALVVGLFTPLAAFGSLILLFTYVMSGVASVCAFYALFAVVLLLVWPTAGWIGIDGLILGYRQNHIGTLHRPQPTDIVPPPTKPIDPDTSGGNDLVNTTLGEDVSEPVPSVPVGVSSGRAANDSEVPAQPHARLESPQSRSMQMQMDMEAGIRTGSGDFKDPDDHWRRTFGLPIKGFHLEKLFSRHMQERMLEKHTHDVAAAAKGVALAEEPTPVFTIDHDVDPSSSVSS